MQMTVIASTQQKAAFQRQVDALYHGNPPGDEDSRRDAYRSLLRCKHQLRDLNARIAQLQTQLMRYQSLGTDLLIHSTMATVSDELQKNVPMMSKNEDAIREVRRLSCGLV
jgi:hypothetical protein